MTAPRISQDIAERLPGAIQIAMIMRGSFSWMSGVAGPTAGSPVGPFAVVFGLG
jgi:hypothetical protein